jgi:hypothetical protein
MSQRLKRWESPRRTGRNDKGRGGSARQRQKRKQMQALRRKLKADPTSQPPAPDSSHPVHHSTIHLTTTRGKSTRLPFFDGVYRLYGTSAELETQKFQIMIA